jgi:hypothetical protein
MKKFTPIIAKINRNKKQTAATFVMLGMEAKRAFTMSFIPLFREIILSGLSARRALRALIYCKLWLLDCDVSEDPPWLL